MISMFCAGPALLAVMAAYGLCFLYFGLRLSISDILSHRLPNKLVLGWLAASAALLLVVSLLRMEFMALLSAGVGLLLLGGGYYLLVLISKGAMGMGDVKLAGVLGLNLGYFSLSALFTATVLAFVIASLVVLVGVALRKMTMKSQVAFGPFMILGTGLALLVTP